MLGESPWFRGLYRNAAEVRVRLSDLPTDRVSVTYPDSFTSMGLLAEFGINVSPRTYHGNVYRVEEIAGVIERYGLLHGAKPDTYEGQPVRRLRALRGSSGLERRRVERDHALTALISRCRRGASERASGQLVPRGARSSGSAYGGLCVPRRLLHGMHSRRLHR